MRTPSAETPLLSGTGASLPTTSPTQPPDDPTQNVIQSPETAKPDIASSISKPLYVSHFLSTWNSRAFEFGAILFLATIFPGTLLPTSIYALARAASAIVLSPVVGHYIDNRNRLQVVRFSIVVQRAAVVVSCITFWYLLIDRPITPIIRVAIMGTLVLLACMEKLCSIMNMIAVERDWVIVIAESNESSLREINSQMRRIDLFCKLIGPLTISLVDGISTKIAILVTLGLNVLSMMIEYYAIAKVYELLPALQAPRHASSRDAVELTLSGTRSSYRPFRCLIFQIRSIFEALVYYSRHSAFLPSIALSLLYFTVLSFAGQMVTYLFSVGYNSVHIGFVRTVSVVFEISATWIAPRIMAKLGPIRSGMWFLSWQTICLTVAVSLFWGARLPLFAASGLVGGVIASRVGLWGFDLCVQIIIQEEVEPDYRGSFSSLEASFQNAFELCSYTSTIIFSRPEEFRYPALISSVAVCVAGALYAKFVRERRGHLLHMPSCMKAREQEGWQLLHRRRFGWQSFSQSGG